MNVNGFFFNVQHRMWENIKKMNSTNNKVNKYKREHLSYFQIQVTLSKS